MLQGASQKTEKNGAPSIFQTMSFTSRPSCKAHPNRRRPKRAVRTPLPQEWRPSFGYGVQSTQRGSVGSARPPQIARTGCRRAALNERRCRATHGLSGTHLAARQWDEFLRAAGLDVDAAAHAVHDLHDRRVDATRVIHSELWGPIRQLLASSTPFFRHGRQRTTAS